MIGVLFGGVMWVLPPVTPPCVDDTVCDLTWALVAPDDGVPVVPGVSCVQQPTADAEYRCVLERDPPPSSGGAEWCAWQYRVLRAAGVEVDPDACSWHGVNYPG